MHRRPLEAADREATSAPAGRMLCCVVRRLQPCRVPPASMRSMWGQGGSLAPRPGRRRRTAPPGPLTSRRRGAAAARRRRSQPRGDSGDRAHLRMRVCALWGWVRRGLLPRGTAGSASPMCMCLCVGEPHGPPCPSRALTSAPGSSALSGPAGSALAGSGGARMGRGSEQRLRPGAAVCVASAGCLGMWRSWRGSRQQGPRLPSLSTASGAAGWGAAGRSSASPLLACHPHTSCHLLAHPPSLHSCTAGPSAQHGAFLLGKSTKQSSGHSRALA